MIRQQINLHQPIFRKQQALFSATILLRIGLIWAVALGLIYGAALWRDQTQRGDVLALTRERDRAQSRLTEISARQADPERIKTLQNQLALLEGERAQKENVLALLSSGELGDTTGFSPQIDSLAERRTAGVWLTHIGLTAGGRQLDLRGAAVREDLLPEYLDRLADVHGVRDGFAGTRFAKVTMERSADGQTVAFELDTEAGKDPGSRKP